MAGQSGLPPKVIKHWFRNTLFKERQRNKDSPYNFNNPPSTTLNLEEYEKTGEAKVMPLNSTNSSDDGKQNSSGSGAGSTSVTPQPEIKQEMKEEPVDDKYGMSTDDKSHHQHQSDNMIDEKPNMFNLPPHLQPSQSPAPSLTGSENHSIPQTSRPNTPNNLTLTSIIASQLGESITTTSTPCSMAVTSSNSHPLPSTMLPPPKLNPQSFTSPNNVQNMLPLTPNRSLSPNRGDFPTGAGGNSNGSNSSGGSTGKRANRTRFTDYQIKVLQEFFENNAYPKDDDLEYLSKLLSLSPRVIVVWFQNARQKARKVYENQPAIEPAPGIPDETGANRFQRTPGLNYQCKKCLLVFQRYYELIRHQKTHCFKEEDAKRSAQAQAAAAQIAAVLSSEDSNSSTTIEQSQSQQTPVQQSPQIQAPSQSPVQPNQPTTPTPSGSNFPTSPISTPTPTSDTKEGTFQCDKCNLVFPRFDLWREHQLVHLMNPNLFPTYPPDSPFGILQQHAQLQQLNAAAGMGVSDLTNNSGTSPIQQHPLMGMLNNAAAAAASAGQKRKFDDYESESDVSDQPKDKRLRTTILPEQLDYLYQKYQIESNPSRKMLENIAREVGLKKRVVQVWFQNTRARERKGQFRAHAQVINKRCPFCPALFKVKSALESHLTTKHADQCSRGEINIDALPDEELSMESAPSFTSGGGDSKFAQTPNMMPPLFPPFHPDMENSIKKYYEESMKRYISELQAHAAATNGDKSEMKSSKEEGEVPLDLSKPVDLSRPMKVSMDLERSLIDPGPLTDLSERSLCDERSDSMSETTEFFDDESNPTSPASSTQSNQRHQQGGSGGGSGTKRFRTQMSSLQVKVMKSLFSDYKTPTMAECEMLGREIGLPKRVVQVWFQNARAKEKKNKLAMQKMLGTNESDTPKTPEDCKYCAFKYSHKYSVQDHIFTKSHIANVKMHLENSGKDGSVSDGGEFTVPPVPGSSQGVPVPGGGNGSGGGGAGGNGAGAGGMNADSTTNIPQAMNNNTHLAQMQLLQMAGIQMKGDKDENQEALFQQLYALGGGVASVGGAGTGGSGGGGSSSGAASGFGTPNQFLHPAMFGGANGE